VSASGEINSICILHLSWLCMYHTGRLSKTFYTQRRASLESAGNTIAKCSLWRHMALPDTRSPHFMCVISTVASIWWDSCESYHSVMATVRRFRWKSGKFHSLLERWYKCIQNDILCYFIAFYKTFHVHRFFKNYHSRPKTWLIFLFSTLFHVQAEILSSK
jgi:hypothetical protein